MSPLGYPFILAGAFLIRQTVVGRVTEIPGDARDATTALLSANWSEFGSVLARRGENVSVESASSSGADSTDTFLDSVSASLSSSQFLAECVKLGSKARGYALGGTGPSYYDCSGLLWKAAYRLKVYTGNRFTTSSFKRIASGWCSQVDSPAAGDIVLWEGLHMGVCAGDDKMYSARSPSKGIGYSTISGDSGYFGKQPSYWRITR